MWPFESGSVNWDSQSSENVCNRSDAAVLNDDYARTELKVIAKDRMCWYTVLNYNSGRLGRVAENVCLIVWCRVVRAAPPTSSVSWANESHEQPCMKTIFNSFSWLWTISGCCSLSFLIERDFNCRQSARWLMVSLQSWSVLNTRQTVSMTTALLFNAPRINSGVHVNAERAGVSK